eukprot:3613105-Rhodomonas_salina.4
MPRLRPRVPAKGCVCDAKGETMLAHLASPTEYTAAIVNIKVRIVTARAWRRDKTAQKVPKHQTSSVSLTETSPTPPPLSLQQPHQIQRTSAVKSRHKLRTSSGQHGGIACASSLVSSVLLKEGAEVQDATNSNPVTTNSICLPLPK